MNDFHTSIGHVYIGFLWAYWWLLFPLGFMAMGLVRMILRNSYEQKKLELLKSYIDQGKDIPDILRRDPYC